MKRIIVSVALAAWLSLACFISHSAAATPQQIDHAISRGVAFLYSKQHDGNWEVVASPQSGPGIFAGDVKGSQWGGISAICTFALLAAGESAQDPRLAKSIEWLRTADIQGTYAVGMRSQVWTRVAQSPQVKLAVKKDADFLMHAMKSQGPGRGLYHYTIDPKSSDYDHSASQFAVLGEWAAAQSGYEIPRKYWDEVDRAWRAHQYEDGSWSYRFKGTGDDADSRPSMTAAGVATLL